MKIATAPGHLFAAATERLNDFKSSPEWKAKMALLDEIHREIGPPVEAGRRESDGELELDYQLD